MRLLRNPILYGVLIILLLSLAGAYTYATQKKVKPAPVVTFKTTEESDVAIRFIMDGYDLIQANYWKGAPDSDLSQLFLLSTNKAASVTETLSTADRAGTAKMLAHAFVGKDTEAKKKLATDTLTVALYNLAPAGRAQLLSSQAQTELTNTVTNINPENNLYKTLGVPDNSAPEVVSEAYKQKKTELEATSSPTKAKDLESIAYAHKVLTDAAQKNVYDATKVEPTVFSRLANAKTLYVYISKMSPTTQSEFEKALNAVTTNTEIHSLILDVRGNIGGDLSFAQTFMGLFLGPNQFAYDMFVHGTYEAQRTAGLSALPGLKRIREIALLTDNMSQSTAEVIAAALKRTHMGHVVGATTRGWGSIERVFQIQTPLDPKQTYGILMVVALTVRDDAQPIEGSGVIPDVSITSPNWKSELSNYFFSPDIISAIKAFAASPPQK